MPLLSKLSYWIGQALDNSGGTHPPGWVAFQRWSATASQWQSKDASDTALWQGRANTAYDSGTWGVGNTWQTDYNNELAAYNAEVAAYNAALAANLTTFSGGLSGSSVASAFGTLSMGAPAGNAFCHVAGGNLVIDKAGTYALYCEAILDPEAGTGSGFSQMQFTGIAATYNPQGGQATGDSGGGGSQITAYFVGSIGAGTTISVQAMSSFHAHAVQGGAAWHLTFVPTQSVPH